MTDKFELSRRKVLGGLGTIGVASAGAGLGTTAFFSDTESFDGNKLTAGSLDLKMDWQEHYSDWSSDEEQYAGMASSESTADYVLPGGPAGESILLTISDEDEFMAATSIEAFPDKDNDAINDYDATLEALTDTDASDPGPGDICNIGADTPEDLDPTTGYRTKNADTYDQESGTYKPLISIDDVKPGDFGEVTFSAHLCGNPGYLWMFASNVDGSENGYTEPEIKDDDESGDADGDGVDDTVELLDKIQARAWYDGAGHIGGDSGNNLKDADEPTIVGPDSLRNVLSALQQNPGVPLSAANFTKPHCGASQDGSGIDGSSTFTCVGSTSVNPDCESQGYKVGVKFDESELPDQDGNYHTITKTVTIDGTDYDFSVEVKVTAEDDGQPQKLVYQNLEVNGTEAGAGLVIVKGGPNANLCTPDDGPASGSGSYDLHPPINPNNGKPYAISHIDFCIANGMQPPDAPPRTCLVNSTTVYVGFEWWLPINHGNEVQTDSVSFDLGFYTEQCRHNDGTGMQRQ
ncbi:SipW-dependent-type signal peptide-containing protein [Halomicroarcula sp. F13]|uniref:SipW-dependent-type signal peptide-containing protein n=1 Tax=Haloarcula rubra TaxID=2487747 RepID=A0AAW4PUY9_9EURY|nr:SipW-dependent-type signal peptide-containing protein [Halomicroarcula rubra]MBX0324335.1 SipW-dependent-type signal peptide-containing protein [Halomicroarcula rubra]